MGNVLFDAGVAWNRIVSFVCRINAWTIALLEQKMVDEADTFPVVLQRVVAWLQERELGTKYKYAMLTDG